MLTLTKMFFVVFLFSAATCSHAQNFNTLVSFDGTNGQNPYFAALIQGANGNFYGTTLTGGTISLGTVFEITAAGTLTTLYSFCSQENCIDGAVPQGGLVRGKNGNLYGTTSAGGTNFDGTVFELTPAGVLSILHSFDGTDGFSPVGALVQAKNGNFYGTTSNGGANGGGTVFEVTGEGTFTTLYSFCAQSNCSDGSTPFAGLVQATNGTFYGTTMEGGNGFGTIFEITPAGKFTNLHSFSSSDGANPSAPLIQATNGTLYGTTSAGGTRDDGTIFKITANGKLATIYNFCVKTYCTDGALPLAGLIQASNGNFYGTTYGGGSNFRGTIFEITSTGKLTSLYSFCSLTDCADGEYPYAGLVQAAGGTFYGTTFQGGTDGLGTVFSLE